MMGGLGLTDDSFILRMSQMKFQIHVRSQQKIKYTCRSEWIQMILIFKVIQFYIIGFEKLNSLK